MPALAVNPLDSHSVLSSFGAWGLFIVLVVETGLLIGLVLPGDSLLFTAGLLCATSNSQSLHLSLPEVLLAAAAGALVGAQLGYWLGGRAGPTLLSRPARPRLQAGFLRASESLDRYGPAKAIVLARFIPIVRTVINPLAGMVGVGMRTFTLAQTGGGLLWALGVTLAGYALGSRIPNIDTYLLPIIAVIVVRLAHSDSPGTSPCPTSGRTDMSNHLSWLEAGVIGAFQGVSELFPISSLGHSVLIPAWVGGSWQRDLDVSSPESPYLAFIVGLHVATALALIVYFWRDWVRIVKGLGTSIARREVRTADQRLAWMLVLATIPVGLVGLVGEHFVRTHLGKPTPAAIFLMINGLILLFAEHQRRNDLGRNTEYVDERLSGPQSDERLGAMTFTRAVEIGSLQIAALAPGISRSGHHHLGRLYGRTHPRRRGPILVPAGHPGHPGRRRTQARRSLRSTGQRHPRPGAFRLGLFLHRGLPVGALPHPLLRRSFAATVRHLLPHRRSGQPDPLRRPLSLTASPRSAPDGRMKP